MSLVSFRNLIFWFYASFIYIYYAFLATLGENPAGLTYWSIIVGAIALFVICIAHLFVLAFSAVSLQLVAGLGLTLVALSFGLISGDNFGLINLLFFLVFAASFYHSPLYSLVFFINFAFLLTLVWSVTSYYIGLNAWGFFPGQATSNLSQGLWWRVSLFPFQTPPFSGAFCLIVFFMNVLSQRGGSKVIALLALYFVVLSGSRTVMVAFLLGGLYFLFFGFKNNRSFFAFFIVIFLVSILMILSNAPEVLYPIFSWSDFLSSAILRVAPGGELQYEQDARSVMFFEFIRVITSSWPFGVGAAQFNNIYQGPGGSEMAALRTVAESGVFGLMVVLSFVFLCFLKTLGSKLFFFIFIIFFIFYSSFLAPYSLIFLAMLSLFSLHRDSKVLVDGKSQSFGVNRL